MTSWTLANVYSSSQAGCIISQGGVPLPNLPVQIYVQGTQTLATLYTDHTAKTQTANPFVTGPDGTFEVWLMPGTYTPVPVGGTPLRDFVVFPNPADPVLLATVNPATTTALGAVLVLSLIHI